MNNVTGKYLSKKLVYCLLKLFYLAYTFRSKGNQVKESEYFEGSWNTSRGLVHISLALGGAERQSGDWPWSLILGLFLTPQGTLQISSILWED